MFGVFFLGGGGWGGGESGQDRDIQVFGSGTDRMEPHVQGQSTSPLVREGGLCGSHASAPVREGSWVRRSCLTKQGRQRWAQMLLMPWICSDFLIYMNVLCFGRGKEEERGK